MVGALLSTPSKNFRFSAMQLFPVLYSTKSSLDRNNDEELDHAFSMDDDEEERILFSSPALQLIDKMKCIC